MLNRIIPILLVSSLALSPVAAATPSIFSISIAGASMTCTSVRGEQVKIRSNIGLGTLGRAFREADGSPVIELQPGMLSTYSPQVQTWWFAHECAHLQLSQQQNTEDKADCLAARSMKKELRLGGSVSAATFKRELHSLQASDTGHSTGADRAATIIRCAGIAQNLV